MRLAEKVILITGSCTGIGAAIARRCVAEGARVLIHGLEADLGQALCDELGPTRAILHVEDLAKEEVASRLVDTVTKAFGRLDAVVNNAARVIPSNLQTTSLTFFREMLEINTLAPLALIQAALPHLRHVHGCVLNIGSVNAWCGEPDLLAYSVSKGALTTLTRNLGDVLHQQEGVRVNQINPGWVLTEREAQRKAEQGLPVDWYRSVHPQFAPSGRLITPDEMAAAAVYWLSDESGPISGQVVDLEQYPLIGRNPPKHI